MDSSHTENMRLHEGPMLIALLGIPLITSPRGFPWLPSCSLRPSLRIAISCEHFSTSPQPGLTKDDSLTPVTQLFFLLCKLHHTLRKSGCFPCLPSQSPSTLTFLKMEPVNFYNLNTNKNARLSRYLRHLISLNVRMTYPLVKKKVIQRNKQHPFAQLKEKGNMA